MCKYVCWEWREVDRVTTMRSDYFLDGYEKLIIMTWVTVGIGVYRKIMIFPVRVTLRRTNISLSYLSQIKSNFPTVKTNQI